MWAWTSVSIKKCEAIVAEATMSRPWGAMYSESSLILLPLETKSTFTTIVYYGIKAQEVYRAQLSFQKHLL